MKAILRVSYVLFVLTSLTAFAHAGIDSQLSVDVGGFSGIGAYADATTGFGYGDFTGYAPFVATLQAGSDFKVNITTTVGDDWTETIVNSSWGPGGTVTILGPDGLTFHGWTDGGGTGYGDHYRELCCFFYDLDTVETKFAGQWSNGLWGFGAFDATIGQAFNNGHEEGADLLLTTYTPDPSTLLLFGSGLGVLGFWKRHLLF